MVVPLPITCIQTPPRLPSASDRTPHRGVQARNHHRRGSRRTDLDAAMAQTERANLDFDSFGTATKRAGTTTTITSDSNHNHNRGGGRQNRHSLLPFRHISSSSDEDGGSHRHGGRFHHSLKLLDRTARTRGQGSTCNAGVNDGGHGSWRGHGHAWSQTSQGSGSGSDAHSPSDSATSSPAMTKEEFEALPLTIQRKVSQKLD